MTPLFQKHGVLIIWLVTAIAMVLSAYLAKGSVYENAWLYIFGVGSILVAFWEVYSRKNKGR